MNLEFNAEFRFEVIPDEKTAVVIIVELSYPSSNDVSAVSISRETDLVTLKRGDKTSFRVTDIEVNQQKDFVWHSSDTSIVKIGATTGKAIVYETGNVYITVSNDSGYYHQFMLKSIIDYVNIMPDTDGFNKVVFKSTNKVWHCINHDMIFDENISENNTIMSLLWDRFRLNYYTDDQCTTIQTYTDDEIRLLYAIDPYGIAKYVQEYADSLTENDCPIIYQTGNKIQDSLKATLNYKDSIFKVLYNRKPYYFDRMLSGNWYITDNTSDLTKVLSESESLFGMHIIYDFNTVLKIIDAIFDIASIVLTCGTLADFEKIEKAFEISFAVISLGESIVKNELQSFTSDTAISEFFEEMQISWAYNLVNTFKTVKDISESFETDPKFSSVFIKYCNNLNYKISIQTQGDEIFTLENLLNLIE